MLIGIANMISGVSGGTMTVPLGTYDRLIPSISNLLKDWKESPAALLPIILDRSIGIIGFSHAIELLLSKYIFVTRMTFVGLILGSIPVLVRAPREDLHGKDFSIGVSGVVTFLVLFVVAVFLLMLNEDTEVLKAFTPTAGVAVSLFLIDIIIPATTAVPGVSDSLVMMILGYYYGILEAIRPFIEALENPDTAGPLNGFLLLFPFDVGVLLGVFPIARPTTFLFERYGVQTYYAMFDLIVASPLATFYNTGLFEQLFSLKAGSVLVGIVLVIVGAVVTRYLGEQSKQKSVNKKRS